MKPLPKWGMMLITTANVAIYIGLAVLGWGGWSDFMANSARVGAVITIVVASIAAMFTSGNLSDRKSVV